MSSSSRTITNTVVEYFYPPESEGHRCGYCKSANSNFSHGMWAHQITTGVYEKLINIGWRRSGSYLYKPMNEKVCCPMYTIRNKCVQVEVSRSQRKVLKKFKKYLSDGVQKLEKNHDKLAAVAAAEHDSGEQITQIPANTNKLSDLTHDSKSAECKMLTDIKLPTSSAQQPATEVPNTLHQEVSKKLHPLKKKPLRRERKRQKLLAKGLDPDEFFRRNERNRVKELGSYFMNNPENKIQFQTKLIKVDSEEFEVSFELEHALYQKYQMHTHGDTPHECRASQFRRFLCDNPFKSSTPNTGTFHQQYYVNGVLFAVGVIDILESCVSSVYFFYDPEYSFLSPGTLGALQEISFVNTLNGSNPKMKYYYLGFYIHSCQKMKYKRKFRPCQLVCPVTYQWVDFDNRVNALLDAQSYTRLSNQTTTRTNDINQVLCLYNRRVIPYSSYPNRQSQKTELQSYVDLVTSEIASTMLLYRSSSPCSSSD